MSTLTPPHTPNPPLHPNPQIAEAIQVLAACGATPRSMSKELGIPPSTITQHYASDIDIGLEIANARVAKTFFDLATSGEHPTLTAKWMELRGGWTPTSNINNQYSEADTEIAREKLLKLLNRTATSSARDPQSAFSPALKAVK